MTMIVAVDNNWAIGCRNELLARIPGDQRFFREVTTGNVVVLGRKTLETFPQGQPLKNRTNIILSKKQDYEVRGAVVVHSIEELLEEFLTIKREAKAWIKIPQKGEKKNLTVKAFLLYAVLFLCNGFMGVFTAL